MKISLIIPSLQGGGAEKVVVNLANYWADYGYLVEVIQLRSGGEFESSLNKEIKVINLEATRVRACFIPLFKILKKSNPDLILVSIFPLTILVNIVWKILNLKGTYVAIEHNNLTKSISSRGWISYLKNRLMAILFYRTIDNVIAVSNGVARDLASFSLIQLDRINTIYNPIVLEKLPKNKISKEDSLSLWHSKDGIRILTVGSLTKQKDQRLLIKALSLINKKIPFVCIVLGIGPLKDELVELAKITGLQESIFFEGFVSNPTPYYLSADVFILTSAWEGFGNVLVEALECDLPIISTDCESGPNEILNGGEFGVLVPVSDEMALKKAIENFHLNKPLHPPGHLRAKDFSVEKAATLYEKLQKKV